MGELQRAVVELQEKEPGQPRQLQGGKGGLGVEQSLHVTPGGFLVKHHCEVQIPVGGTVFL